MEDLVDVLAAVGADARMGRHGGGAARALQHLGGRVQVLVEGGELDLEVARRDRQRQVHLGASTRTKKKVEKKIQEQ